MLNLDLKINFIDEFQTQKEPHAQYAGNMSRTHNFTSSRHYLYALGSGQNRNAGPFSTCR